MLVLRRRPGGLLDGEIEDVSLEVVFTGLMSRCLWTRSMYMGIAGKGLCWEMLFAIPHAAAARLR